MSKFVLSQEELRNIVQEELSFIMKEQKEFLTEEQLKELNFKQAIIGGLALLGSMSFSPEAAAEVPGYDTPEQIQSAEVGMTMNKADLVTTAKAMQKLQSKDIQQFTDAEKKVVDAGIATIDKAHKGYQLQVKDAAKDLKVSYAAWQKAGEPVGVGSAGNLSLGSEAHLVYKTKQMEKAKAELDGFEDKVKSYADKIEFEYLS